MREYNVSQGANSQIAGVTPGSQDTAQFNLQGLRKFNISLRANRLSGEFIPAIEGDFLYIARSDIPCTISLIRQDGGHDILANEGDEYHGAFKGVWISHPDTSSVTGAAPLTLTIITGSGEKITNNLGSKTGPRFPQGGIINTGAGAGGNAGVHFWLPENARQVDDVFFYTTMTLTAAAVSDFTGFVNFQIGAGIPAASIANSPVITQGGLSYNLNVCPSAACKCDVINITPLTFVYRVGFRMSAIKIPSYAKQVTARIFVGAGNNLVSASTSFNNVNGDVAAVYIS